MHSTSWGTWSDLPGSLPAFRQGEEPGYEASSLLTDVKSVK